MDGHSLYWSFHCRDNPVLNVENWQKIDDLPYYVSNLGNVKRDPKSKYNHKNKQYIKPYINNKGYLCVNLYKNSKVHKFQVHRLIAMYFIHNPSNLPEVNHIDGDKLNNAIPNLEWCTREHNMKHAWDTGLVKNRRGNASVKRKTSTSKYKGVSWSSERKRWAVYITVDKKRVGVGRFMDERQAAEAYDNYVKLHNLESLGYSTNF